jgi:hypothetical protein
MAIQSPVCQCLVNTHWTLPLSSTERKWATTPDEWPIDRYPPPKSSPQLTLLEQTVLANLVAAWKSFVTLEHRSGNDDQEFRDAIHRCQQLVALRVARRVDPEVWLQPKETN